MIVRLEIENFFSVKQRQIFDLAAAANVPNDAGHLVGVLPGLRVPKVAVLYGPNASGKTTVLRALTFLANFSRQSFHRPPDASLAVDPFLSPDRVSSVTRLSVQFAGVVAEGSPASLHTYTVAILHEPGGANSVHAETLHDSPGGKRRRLFARAGNAVEGSRAFALGARDFPPAALRRNASLIATLAQFAHGPSLRIVQGLGHVRANLDLWRFELPGDVISQYYSQQPSALARLNDALPALDLGLRRAHLQQGQGGYQALFEHEGLDGVIPLRLESGGTQSFFRMFPLVNAALEHGNLAIVDELDAEIHAAMLPEIARWFRDPARNPHNAQLIAACHNTSLMEHLEKEEIFFTDKDTQGQTSVFGLKDVQGVRRGENFGRKYLDGVYGAVPRLG